MGGVRGRCDVVGREKGGERMNPLHLIWIIPLSAAVGFFWAAILAAGRDE